MSPKVEAVLETALELPEQERAELVTRLLDSLDGDIEPDVEAAWAAEITRRVEALDAALASGERPGRPWEEVKADLARRRARNG